jgi:hypothetical protein
MYINPLATNTNEIKTPKQDNLSYYKELDKEVIKVEISQVTKLVEDFVVSKEQKQQQQQNVKAAPKKSRVQGG